jgi:hypothetical protein
MRMAVYKELEIIYFVRNEGLMLKGKSGAPKFAHNIYLRSKLGLI